jgi:RNA polymerase sigma factor (sigma-70 family)
MLEEERRADLATPEGFRAAVEAAHEPLLRVAVRMTGDSHLAEDLVQEALVRAFASRGRFRGDARPFTWFCSILLNLVRSDARRRAIKRFFSLTVDHDAPSDAPGPAAVAERTDEGDALRAAIAELPHGQRAALVLVSLEGLSAADAARALDTTEEAVWQALSRGRAALRRILR